MFEWIKPLLISWYKFMMAERPNLRNGDIRVVVGSMKTCSWGRVVFTRDFAYTRPEADNFRLEFEYFNETQHRTRHRWEKHGDALHIDVGAGGPTNADEADLRSPSSPDAKFANQTLFLQTINPKLSDLEWQALKDELQFARQPSGSLSPQRSSGRATPKSKATGFFETLLRAQPRKKFPKKGSNGKKRPAGGDEGTKAPLTSFDNLSEGDSSASESEAESLGATTDESEVEDNDADHLEGFANAWKDKACVGVVSIWMQ